MESPLKLHSVKFPLTSAPKPTKSCFNIRLCCSKLVQCFTPASNTSKLTQEIHKVTPTKTDVSGGNVREWRNNTAKVVRSLDRNQIVGA